MHLVECIRYDRQTGWNQGSSETDSCIIFPSLAGCCRDVQRAFLRRNLASPISGQKALNVGYPHRLKLTFIQYLHIYQFSVSDKQYMHLLLRSIIHTKLKLLEAYTRSVRPTYVLEQHFGIPHEGEHVRDRLTGLLRLVFWLICSGSLSSLCNIWRTWQRSC